jgi:hypothetical protein
MNCLRPLEHWDRGFESNLRHGCLFCVHAALCVGSGLAMCRSTVQGVLPTVYRITKLKKQPGPNKEATEPLTNKYRVRWLVEEVFLCSPQRIDRLCLPLSLWNGYRGFIPGVKVTERGTDHISPHSTDVNIEFKFIPPPICLHGTILDHVANDIFTYHICRLEGRKRTHKIIQNKQFPLRIQSRCLIPLGSLSVLTLFLSWFIWRHFHNYIRCKCIA